LHMPLICALNYFLRYVRCQCPWRHAPGVAVNSADVRLPAAFVTWPYPRVSGRDVVVTPLYIKPCCDMPWWCQRQIGVGYWGGY